MNSFPTCLRDQTCELELALLGVGVEIFFCLKVVLLILRSRNECRQLLVHV